MKNYKDSAVPSVVISSDLLLQTLMPAGAVESPNAVAVPAILHRIYQGQILARSTPRHLRYSQAVAIRFFLGKKSMDSACTERIDREAVAKLTSALSAVPAESQITIINALITLYPEDQGVFDLIRNALERYDRWDCTFWRPLLSRTQVCDDADTETVPSAGDDIALACAEVCEPDYLLTLSERLLEEENVGRTAIVTADEFCYLHNISGHTRD